MNPFRSSRFKKRFAAGCGLLVAAAILAVTGGAWLIAEGPHGPGGSVTASEMFPFGFPMILLGLGACLWGFALLVIAIVQWLLERQEVRDRRPEF